MSLIALRGLEQPFNYGQLRARVVDDFPGMRNALKMTLSNFGVTRIDLAGSATEAIFKVQNGHYDFILCDFNLGEGRDGQQLLEELRYRELIGLKTVFVMVTAESVYEKVVSTAELAPDDYLLKPFSAEVMRNRLEISLRRKQAFEAAFHCHEEGDLGGAIAACDLLLREKPKYLVDALRFKGESLNALGRYAEAEELYRRVISMRPIPWARLGLAKALHLQNEDDAAEALLREVLERAPQLVTAYDVLADIRLAKKDATGAQRALQAGVAISARTVRRQQKLGNLALDNGDLDTARTAFATAIDKGQHSVFITPGDYGNLCRIHLEQGNLSGAMDTLRKGKLALQATPEGQLVVVVVHGQVHNRNGNHAEARKSLDEAARLRAIGARVDGHFLLELAQGFLAYERHAEADATVSEVARNAHDSEVLLARAKRLYEAAGRANDVEHLLSEATREVRKLTTEGVMLAHKGDIQTAVERLLAACSLAPFNPRILMNGVWVILKGIELDGMNTERLTKARSLLAAAERQNPGHSRIAGLRSQLQEFESRFGLRRRSV